MRKRMAGHAPSALFLAAARALLACSLLLALAPFAPATAQESGEIQITLPADLPADQRDAFLRSLGELEDIAVVTGAGDPADAEAGGFTLAMRHLDQALTGLPDVPAAAAAWWDGLSRQGGAGSFPTIVALIVAIAAGAAAEWATDALLARWRKQSRSIQSERFSRRLGAGLSWFMLELAGIAAFAAGMLAVGWLLLPALPGPRFTLAILTLALFRIRAMLALVRLIFAPHRPAMRMVGLTDSQAQRCWRVLAIVISLSVGARAARDLLVNSGATAQATALLGLGVAAVVLVAQIYMVLGIRDPVRTLLLGVARRWRGGPAKAVSLFAEVWHVVLLAVVLLSFATMVLDELTMQSASVSATAFGPMFWLVLLPFVLGAYACLIDDTLIADAEGTQSAVVGQVVKTLGLGTILLVTSTLAARSMGANAFLGEDGSTADRVAGALLEAAGALLVGWALWMALKVFLEQEVPADEEEQSEDGMGKPGSRIATLLPVLRSFLFVAIIAITGIMALSALGIQIGPLLAGAGVIGLAIGFGAQTLVRDVITGIFYLMEDAFRQGEYIESDAGKGVVEKISMRSVRLRHHRGALYTIPFGNMGNIVNHSRDWVKIKLLIRVPFDTDIEQVRKLIKRVGQEMQDDPVLGSQFIQPVKSQGVTDVEGSGFVIGVKFICRPGEQFVLRREAYARIKQAFAASGIEFASPRVMVDSDGDPERLKDAAAAAALPPPAKA